jgi:hypothetical protein
MQRQALRISIEELEHLLDKLKREAYDLKVAKDTKFLISINNRAKPSDTWKIDSTVWGKYKKRSK